MQKLLGRWAAPEDPRSRSFAYSGALASTLSVVHGAHAPITDQDGIGACVGFSGVDMLNYALFMRSRAHVARSNRYLVNDKGFEFYSLATIEDEWPNEMYPPTDLGSSILAGAKVLKNLGYVDRYEWAFTFDSFLAAVQRQPVMVGTLWTAGMYDPDSSGLVRPTGDLSGGHAYTVRGVNFSKRRVLCRNHWGKGWGVGGEFFVGFDDMAWLLAQNGDCVVPIPRSVVGGGR